MKLSAGLRSFLIALGVFVALGSAVLLVVNVRDKGDEVRPSTTGVPEVSDFQFEEGNSFPATERPGPEPASVPRVSSGGRRTTRVNDYFCSYYPSHPDCVALDEQEDAERGDVVFVTPEPEDPNPGSPGEVGGEGSPEDARGGQAGGGTGGQGGAGGGPG
jgi:hypothetical protein